MTFTDEDLKRLKKMLDPILTERVFAEPIDKWRALLARLEAAEDFMFAGDDSFREKLNIWRKASGKVTEED